MRREERSEYKRAPSKRPSRRTRASSCSLTPISSHLRTSSSAQRASTTKRRRAPDPRPRAQWGHLNPASSMLTAHQSLWIDDHHTLQMSFRSAAWGFINFTGTAGTWREPGDRAGWSVKSLVEDCELRASTPRLRTSCSLKPGHVDRVAHHGASARTRAPARSSIGPRRRSTPARRVGLRIPCWPRGPVSVQPGHLRDWRSVQNLELDGLVQPVVVVVAREQRRREPSTATRSWAPRPCEGRRRAAVQPSRARARPPR